MNSFSPNPEQNEINSREASFSEAQYISSSIIVKNHSASWATDKKKKEFQIWN